jgi:hypothetical protein
MDFLRSDRNALWLAPVVLGIGSCLCSFAPMLYFWGTVVIPIDAEHMPLGDAFTYGAQLTEHLSTWQALYTILMYCIPLGLMLVVGAVSFFLIRGYQNPGSPSHKTPAPPPR